MLGPVGGAIFHYNAPLLWWAAAAVGATTTVGLGLATGNSIQQPLFEGLATFGIVSGLSKLAPGGEEVYSAAMGGMGEAGGLLDHQKDKSPKTEPGDGVRVPQGNEFPDQSTNQQSASNASSTANSKYYQNAHPAIISNRINDGSTVGGTFASQVGNDSNGVGSRAYSWCFEKARLQAGLGTFSEAQVAFDREMCERSKSLSVQAMALFVGGVSKGVRNGVTTFFRAVSKAEYKQILKTGKFEVGPNSYEGGKFFAESLDDASRWGQKFYGTNNFYTIEMKVSNNVANQMMRWPKLDSIGLARFGTLEQLENANIRL